MYAIKSVMSCGLRMVSKPSGISESFELVSSLRSLRKMTSSAPPAFRSVMLFGVSTAMMPLSSRPLLVTAV